MEITRKALVKIAFKAIRKAEKNGDEVARSDRNHLLYAACTIDQVALGAWVIDNKCGCLVGSMLLAEDRKTDNFIAFDRACARSLLQLGVKFDDYLALHLVKKYSVADDDHDALVSQAIDVID